jgi:hypothetical protein
MAHQLTPRQDKSDPRRHHDQIGAKLVLIVIVVLVIFGLFFGRLAQVTRVVVPQGTTNPR